MNALKASRVSFTRRPFQRRPMATSSHPMPKKMEGPGEDFRPPWVYVGTRLISFAIIPAVGFYAVFFYDFGNHEHVFQPVS
ncbi:hypothetical protein GALMADRAFT_220663 [Galerina marginata CBS 339.88]|uniref:Uncharacterized protein n=1 Tax=Galerina marginata (strain CBS 339.88) TaxID=685588 RepID=A0A067TRX6_GALM3|nr:hypothetical protein GALMADRAFT_220663 [Galerina marginata CBS 339.88]